MLKRTLAVAILALSTPAFPQDKPGSPKPADAGGDISVAQPNQPLYVREGDLWTKVTLIKREGRKYQIKYDDGTDEWVTPERLRLTPPKPADAPPAPARAAQPAGKTGFKVGEVVEMKERDKWIRMTIEGRQGDWFQVGYIDSWKGWHLWAEPWRLRKVGSTYDIEGNVDSVGKTFNPLGAPPRMTPGMPKGQTTGDNGSGIVNKPEDQDATPLGVKVASLPHDGKDLFAVANEWSYQVPPLDPKTRIGAPATPLILPGMSGGGSFSDLRLHGRKGIISAHSGRGGMESGDAAQGLIKVDLAANTVSGINLDSGCRACDISPNGNLILGVSTGKMGVGKSIVYVLKLVGTKTEPTLAFKPDDGGDEVRDVCFIDDQTILTLSKRELSCWDFAKNVQLWRTTANGYRIAVSPDSKTAAVGTPDGIALISIGDAKVMGVIDTAPSPLADIAFSGDGKSLIVMESPTIEVWDLSTGKSQSRFGIPQGIAGKLMPLSSEFLMVGDTLFSIARCSPAWRYAGGGVQAYAGGRVWHSYDDGRRSVLTSAEIPHARAKQLAQAATDSVQVVKPGTSVSIVINVEADEATRKLIVDNFTAQLKRGGVSVADNQPVRIVAKMGDTKTEQREYRHIGFGSAGQPNESVTITSQQMILAFEYQDKTLWQTTSVTSNDLGMMVDMRQGETLQQRMDKVKGNAAAWLTMARIPTALAGPIDLNTLPTSTWALGGVKDR